MRGWGSVDASSAKEGDTIPSRRLSEPCSEGSWTASVAEAATEFLCGSAVDEVPVGVLPGGEIDDPHLQPGRLQS